jgi:hypothetical protein
LNPAIIGKFREDHFCGIDRRGHRRQELTLDEEIRVLIIGPIIKSGEAKGVAQGPIKCRALSSTPSTAKKKKKV